MGGRELIDELQNNGTSIRAEGDTLVIRPPERLTAELRAQLGVFTPKIVEPLLGSSRP